MNTKELLNQLDLRIAFWKNTQPDPYNIATPVMVALGEIKEAIIQSDKASRTRKTKPH